MARTRATAFELGFEPGNENRMDVEVTVQDRVDGVSPPPPGQT